MLSMLTRVSNDGRGTAGLEDIATDGNAAAVVLVDPSCHWLPAAARLSAGRHVSPPAAAAPDAAARSISRSATGRCQSGRRALGTPARRAQLTDRRARHPLSNPVAMRGDAPPPPSSDGCAEA